MPTPGTSRWAARARPVIALVIAANPSATEDELRKLISAHYCFGPREMHPYKQWCLEVRAQVNVRFRGKATRERPPKHLPELPLFQPPTP